MGVVRIALANVLLFVGYTGIWMAGVWWDTVVVRNQQNSLLVFCLIAWMLSALPVACLVNWWLLRIRNRVRRILIGIGIGALAFGAGYLPFCFAAFFFYMAIGGSLS